MKKVPEPAPELKIEPGDYKKGANGFPVPYRVEPMIETPMQVLLEAVQSGRGPFSGQDAQVEKDFQKLKMRMVEAIKRVMALRDAEWTHAIDTKLDKLPGEKKTIIHLPGRGPGN